MTIEEFINDTARRYAENFPDNDCTGIILLACAGDDPIKVRAGNFIHGKEYVLMALVSMNIDHEMEGTEKAFEILRDCVGIEFARRTKSIVKNASDAAAAAAKATENLSAVGGFIKENADGNMLTIQPPKTKS